MEFIREFLQMDFIQRLWESEFSRYLIIMLGFHLVMGMFGVGCCSRRKHRKGTKKNGSCH
ncbi:hypothetical protein PM10SUCC1_35790 [Propionigenium maris DSM 9537]|uniref:Uncharacterized protein n=1 Tax=Propionigenium maris DSM 9537 TaxID=1123000 RepID=A0A9W6GPU6_9FUSO|nr:hypothetical protein [Propionigenium maris]GLI58065.1 hypothetical protein PM10SUCC1_35790 [Propionigenium maris DSM 9537]